MAAGIREEYFELLISIGAGEAHPLHAQVNGHFRKEESSWRIDQGLRSIKVFKNFNA